MRQIAREKAPFKDNCFKFHKFFETQNIPYGIVEILVPINNLITLQILTVPTLGMETYAKAILRARLQLTILSTSV